MAITTHKRLDMTALRQAIQRLLNLPNGTVRPLQSQAPSGDSAFLMVYAKQAESQGVATAEFEGEHETETLFMTFRTTVMVSALGENGFDVLLKLLVGLQSSEGRNALKQLGCGLEQIHSVEETPQTDTSHLALCARTSFVLIHQHAIQCVELATHEAPFALWTS